MDISLSKVGKRYRFEWIFKGMDYHFQSGGRYAILGSNGSGKSTLMRVLSGHLTASKGRVSYRTQEKNIPVSDVYREISYAAPYIDLVEEFRMREAVMFHQKFKPLMSGMDAKAVRASIPLPRSAWEKEIRFFSSGMKQRLKLALAILSDTPLLLLDEPTTNLDRAGMDWYLDMITRYAAEKTIIVASNEERDYGFCEYQMDITDYKPKAKPKG